MLKFLLTFLLCDAYLMWFHVKNRQYESICSNDQQLFYELEWNFYFMLIQAFINYIIFACTILMLCGIEIFVKNNYKTFSRFSKKNVFYLIIKLLVMSSFGKLIVLPLVIWNPHEIYFNLALLFTYISNSNALSVITKIPKGKASLIIGIAATSSHMFNEFIQLIMK